MREADTQQLQLQRLIDESQIRRLLDSYPRALDRQDHELLASLYHPDAKEDHGVFNGSAAGYVDFIESHAVPGNYWMHHNGTMHIEIDGDVALTETYTLAFYRIGPKEGDSRDREIFLRVRYIDRIEKRDGEWKIAHRRVIYSPCRVVTVDEEFWLLDDNCLREGDRNADAVYGMRRDIRS